MCGGDDSRGYRNTHKKTNWFKVTYSVPRYGKRIRQRIRLYFSYLSRKDVNMFTSDSHSIE